MLDSVQQRILEAGFFHRAVSAEPAGNFDAYPITREERLRRKLPALALLHP
jgi:hypothetical protein